MTLPKILITRLIPDAGLTLLKKHYPLFDIWTDELPPTREQLIQKSKGVDALLCTLTEKVDSELMDSIGSQLKVISSMSVGVDHIDIDSATKRKIPVGPLPAGEGS